MSLVVTGLLVSVPGPGALAVETAATYQLGVGSVGETIAIGERIFVSDPAANRVVVAGERGQAGRVTGLPGALGLTTDGRFLYVALSSRQAVAVVDPKTLAEVARIATAPCVPHWLAYTAGRVWVSESCGALPRLGSFGTTDRLHIDAGATPWGSLVDIAASPAYPDALFAAGRGEAPTTIHRAQIAGTSVIGTHTDRSLHTEVVDLHVTADGARLLVAPRGGIEFASFRVQDLRRDHAYPRGVGSGLAVTSSADGGMVIGATAGYLGPSIVVSEAASATRARELDIDSVVERGLAANAKGTLFAITSAGGASTLHVLLGGALPAGSIDARLSPPDPQEREIIEVSGTVRDARGRAVAGRKIEVTEVDPEGRESISTTTDANGDFTSRWYVDQRFGTFVTFEVSWVGDGERTGPTEALVQFSVGSRRRHRALRFDVSGGAVERTIDISRLRFADDTAPYALVGRDDVFADSLAASTLTMMGPLLLTGSAQLDDATLGELQRVLPGGVTVYVLGGPAALAPAVEDRLREAGFATVRLWGPTRVETSVVIADLVRELFGDRGAVLVARAFGPDTSAWADSITGGAVASNFGVPILLTRSEQLDAPVAEALARYDPEVTVLLGGPVALSSAVEQAVPRPVRLWGQDREGTAVAIAQEVWRLDYQDAVVVDIWSADGWQIGLASAGIASDFGAPILGVRREGVSDATVGWLESCGAPPLNMWVIGSEEVILPAVVQRLDGLVACS